MTAAMRGGTIPKRLVRRFNPGEVRVGDMARFRVAQGRLLRSYVCVSVEEQGTLLERSVWIREAR